jgi:hypothetical protein
MLAVDGTQLLVDILPVKAGIKFNKTDRSLECERGADVIWKVVESATRAWKAIPVSSLTYARPVICLICEQDDFAALIDREHKIFLMMPHFSLAPLQMRALFASSIGDFDGMNIMKKYLPGQGAALKVINMHHVTRNTLPQLVPISWQYDGQLTVSFQTSRKWQTQAQMDMFVAAFRRWLDALLHERP